MEEAFMQLRSEASTKDLRTAIETLIDIFRKIHQNPTAEKFRKIRTNNENVVEKFWRFEGAQNFLLLTGWRDDGIYIVLDSDDVTEALKFLIENRFVRPSEQEWVAATKQIIMNPEKERDLRLRAEAFKKKERDMEELRKDMEERKAIAATIIEEHRNDMEKRKIHRRVGHTEALGSPSTALALPGSASTALALPGSASTALALPEPRPAVAAARARTLPSSPAVRAPYSYHI